MNDYRKMRMPVSHGPDLRFEGKVIGEFTTQNTSGTKSRWTELRLWETPAGNWIAESVGMSAHEREGEIREAAVIVQSDGQEGHAPQMIQAVMEAFGWTSAAKAFAREMGWSVVREVP